MICNSFGIDDIHGSRRDVAQEFETLLQTSRSIFFVAYIQKNQAYRIGFFHLCRQAQHRLRGTRLHHDLGATGLTLSQLYAILSSGKAVHDDICYLKY